jgi:hypothetical protein
MFRAAAGLAPSDDGRMLEQQQRVADPPGALLDQPPAFECLP